MSELCGRESTAGIRLALQAKVAGDPGNASPSCGDWYVAKKKASNKPARARQKPKRAGTKKRHAKAAGPKSAAKRAARATDDATIGRVLVSQEEKLYMLFKEDYHARQIFEFLRVETVKDLEQFSPQQIVKLLSQPIQATVLRIRRKLAEKNRHLADDAEFVVEYKKSTASK
jgi:hypothetical protein